MHVHMCLYVHVCVLVWTRMWNREREQSVLCSLHSHMLFPIWGVGEAVQLLLARKSREVQCKVPLVLQVMP